MPELRLDPIAARLAELLGRPVRKVDDCVGPDVVAAAEALAPGGLLLLENLRFHAEETANDPAFAAELAALADVYVNDAFGTAHRAHASTVGVPRILPGVAGLLMARELDVLGRLLSDPARPFVVLLGGAKVSDKIGVIEKMLTVADAILVGGAMCFPLLAAQGLEVGLSKVEEGSVEVAARLLAAAQRVVVRVRAADRHRRGDREPRRRHPGGSSRPAPCRPTRWASTSGRPPRPPSRNACGAAGTVFWNGPMGLFEVAEFAAGTRAVGEAVAACSGVSVVGGGDTVSAVRAFGLGDRITHVSTGGGASMEFLEGRALPGVEALLEA